MIDKLTMDVTVLGHMRWAMNVWELQHNFELGKLFTVKAPLDNLEMNQVSYEITVNVGWRKFLPAKVRKSHVSIRISVLRLLVVLVLLLLLQLLY